MLKFTCFVCCTAFSMVMEETNSLIKIKKTLQFNLLYEIFQVNFKRFLKKETIFVQIKPYRDPELVNTIESIDLY